VGEPVSAGAGHSGLRGRRPYGMPAEPGRMPGSRMPAVLLSGDDSVRGMVPGTYVPPGASWIGA